MRARNRRRTLAPDRSHSSQSLRVPSATSGVRPAEPTERSATALTVGDAAATAASIAAVRTPEAHPGEGQQLRLIGGERRGGAQPGDRGGSSAAI